MQIGGVIGAIKSIQRGVAVLTSAGVTNITIGAVNVGKSTLSLSGSNGVSTGFALADISVTVALTSPTNIAAHRVGGSVNCNVSWELVEFY